MTDVIIRKWKKETINSFFTDRKNIRNAPGFPKIVKIGHRPVFQSLPGILLYEFTYQKTGFPPLTNDSLTETLIWGGFILSHVYIQIYNIFQIDKRG